MGLLYHIVYLYTKTEVFEAFTVRPASLLCLSAWRRWHSPKRAEAVANQFINVDFTIACLFVLLEREFSVQVGA
jgi:hypothetical protein